MGVLRALRHLSAAACVLALAAGTAGAQETLEPDVKAAFLYNFTRYVEWPPEPSTPAEPFRLCVVAENVMKSAIQRTVAGESVNGRPLVMTEPQTAQEAQRCQILFVGRSESRRASTLAASSAAEALALCRTERPDAIVSDIAMPGRDGYSLMRDLRDTRGPGVPRVAVALSAYAAPADHKRSLAAGFHWHVAKPFDPSDLVHALHELLADEAPVT